MTTPICPHCGQPILTPRTMAILNFMRRECGSRGGYMFEGVRPAFEAGKYIDEAISALLKIGAIEPHPDPAKGWIVAEAWK